MPKQVDHEQRRRAIAEAVYTVIGTRGFEAVSLRDVADQAGVSMGAVQHYFPSKSEMLLFALGHMRDRVLARLAAAVARLDRPTTRDLALAGVTAMLPVDRPSREEASVNIAFFSAATVTPSYAEILREGYGRLLAATRHQLRQAAEAGELRPGVDVDRAAAELFFLVQGLIGPMLIGLYGSEEALALVDDRLASIYAV